MIDRRWFLGAGAGSVRFGRSPAAVRGMLDRQGLAAPSSRVSYDALGDRLPQSLEAAKILGQSQRGSYFGVCRTMP